MAYLTLLIAITYDSRLLRLVDMKSQNRRLGSSGGHDVLSGLLRFLYNQHFI